MIVLIQFDRLAVVALAALMWWMVAKLNYRVN